MANRNGDTTPAPTPALTPVVGGKPPRALIPKERMAPTGYVAHNRHANAAEERQREQVREQIADLYVRGFSPSRIASTLADRCALGPTEGARRARVLREIEIIRKRAMVERMASLNHRLADAVMARQTVMSEAWVALSKIANSEKSAKDQAALFNVILDARRDIERLEGTEAPERVNAAAIAEAFEHMMRVAQMIGGPQLQQAFLLALRGEMVESQSGQVLGLGAPHVPSSPPSQARHQHEEAQDAPQYGDDAGDVFFGDEDASESEDA
jgi:hypothetical protein